MRRLTTLIKVPGKSKRDGEVYDYTVRAYKEFGSGALTVQEGLSRSAVSKNTYEIHNDSRFVPVADKQSWSTSLASEEEIEHVEPIFNLTHTIQTRWKLTTKGIGVRV